jgi:hypothetical protein
MLSQVGIEQVYGGWGVMARIIVGGEVTQNSSGVNAAAQGNHYTFLAQIRVDK